MNKVALAILFALPLTAAAQPKGAIRCKVNSRVPLDDDHRARFDCGSGKSRFSMLCDPSDDAEFANENIKSGTFYQGNPNPGLQHKSGFTSCEMIQKGGR